MEEFVNLLGIQVAKAFGVVPKTVTRWSQTGCPRNPDGTYDLKKVIEWAIDRAKTEAGDIPESEESQRWLTEYRKERALIARLERKKMEGSLISHEDFKKAWVWRISEVSHGLGSLPLRLAPLVAGKSELEIRNIIDSEIWKIRDKFARTGKFTPDVPEAKKIYRKIKNLWQKELKK